MAILAKIGTGSEKRGFRFPSCSATCVAENGGPSWPARQTPIYRRFLKSWTCKPAPVRRVEIPKPGGRGTSNPGVPTARDRVVQATLKHLLEPIFEPSFSARSCGVRPGRNQRQAVAAARAIVAGGKPSVVDLDLAQFFDRIHHDRLVARVGEHVPDKRILRLIGRTSAQWCSRQ